MSHQRARVQLLIAFLDLTHFARVSEGLDDAELADVLDAFYEELHAAVGAGGGHVVKELGDGALVVFPADAADRGVLTLLALRDTTDGFLKELGWPCRLCLKVHFGTVVAGPFGGAGQKRYDVIGKAVNATALLPAGGGVVVSTAAMERLGAALRERFEPGPEPGIHRLRDGN